MTPEEARKHVRAYIKRTYSRTKVFAVAKGCSETYIYESVRRLAPWLLAEVGLTKQVEVKYIQREPS
jgi:hypothetical protein